MNERVLVGPNYDLLIVRKTTQNSFENLDHLSDQQLVKEFYENRGGMEYPLLKFRSSKGSFNLSIVHFLDGGSVSRLID